MQIASANVEIQSNFKFDEDEAMTFDEGANAFLLNNLIKQYSNPYLAAFREYTSNARDSHVNAGQTRPIEVTLPNTLSPSLIIEDFGLGLSREDLKGYGQFGKSSKRDSDDYIGGFGLGSKSALAMADQFTVTAVKDELRNTVIVRRREDGSPSMGFLPEREATGEPNGVKVTIPTNEQWKFKEAVESGFFLGWAAGTILIDGEEPKTANVYDETQFTALDGLGWRIKRGVTHGAVTLSKGRVAMMISGVRYELDVRQMEGITSQMVEGFFSEIVINLANGMVEIHPSRETLIYDKRTREYIQAVVNSIIELGQAEYQKDIDESPSLRSALNLRDKARNYGFTKGDYTYKGQPMVSDKTYALELRQRRVTEASFSRSQRYGVDYQSRRSNWTVDHMRRNRIGSIYSENTTSVLVFGASEFVANSNHHMLSNSALLWARVFADTKNVSLSGIAIYYMEGHPRELDRKTVGAFAYVINAKDYLNVVTEQRRQIAKAARDTAKANGTPRTTTKESVRVLNYAANGRSSWREVKIADLDPAAKHIVLKNGESTLIDSYRNYALTVRGNANGYNSAPAKTMAYLISTGHVFILANKNAKTDHLDGTVPNLVTIQKALFTEAKRIAKGYTPMQLRAAADAQRNRYGWALHMPDEHEAKLAAWPELATWVAAMKSDRRVNKTAEDFLGYIQNNAVALGIDAAKVQIKAKMLDVSPADNFPLLKSLSVYDIDWEALIEYIEYRQSI